MNDTPHQLMILPYAAARKFARYHRCAACWGILELYPRDAEFRIECTDCREKTTGYVSSQYVEQRQIESRYELLSAKRNLRGAVSWLQSDPKSEKQLIKEIYSDDERATHDN